MSKDRLFISHLESRSDLMFHLYGNSERYRSNAVNVSDRPSLDVWNYNVTEYLASSPEAKNGILEVIKERFKKALPAVQYVRKGGQFFISYHSSADDRNEFPAPTSELVFFSGGSSINENRINDFRVDDFDFRFTDELIYALKTDPIEPGVVGKADLIVDQCLRINALATLNWLNGIYLSNFSNSSIASDVLMLVGRIDFEVAGEIGMTMAVAGFSNKSDAVKEAAIRAFENWESLKSLEVLRSVQVEPQWLKDYLSDVISDLSLIYEKAC